MEGRWWHSESGAWRDIQAARKSSERTLTGCDDYDDSDGTTELATLRAENARLREEIEKLRSAAGYQAEAHTLRTSAKMTADLVRSWGYANKSNESNGQLVRRVLEELRTALAAKEPGHD